MDKVPVEVAMQQPMLYLIFAFCTVMVGLVLGVVYVCFRQMRADRQETRQYVKENSEFFVNSVSDMGKECHSHQTSVLARIEQRDVRNDTRDERMVRALEKSSEALASNSEVMRNVRNIMQDRAAKTQG